MQLHYLQHVPFETPAFIIDWLKERNHNLTATLLYENEALPALEAIDWLIVMGGPMNVDEETQYSWLANEKAFIRQAIMQGKTVLGICLGAQLIASALGAKVTRSPDSEIGWFPVQLTPAGQDTDLFLHQQGQMFSYQWHGDMFALPEGAVLLAESSGCPHQAFLYQEKVLGLQFHLEMNKVTMEGLMQMFPQVLKKDTYIQTAEEMVIAAEQYMQATKANLYYMLDKLAAKA